MLEPALGITELPSIYGFPGAFISLTLLTYPYVLLPTRAALTNLDPAIEEASRTLGRGTLKTFASITLPALRPATATVPGPALGPSLTRRPFSVRLLGRCVRRRALHALRLRCRLTASLGNLHLCNLQPIRSSLRPRSGSRLIPCFGNHSHWTRWDRRLDTGPRPVPLDWPRFASNRPDSQPETLAMARNGHACHYFLCDHTRPHGGAVLLDCPRG